MGEAAHNRRKQIEALQTAAEAKKQQALKRADDAIRRLALGNERISFAAVAEEAGVSIAYLYKHEELKRRIQTLRLQKEDRLTVSQGERKASDASKQVIVKQLKNRIRELEAEKVEQKREIEALAGQLYELTLEKENITRLKRENERLRKQISSLEQVKTTPSPVPFPPKLSKVVREALSELKIKPSKSLQGILVSYPEDQVLTAIKALEEAKKSSSVRSPTGFLIEALKGAWEPNDLGSMSDKERKEFSRWFDAARKKGLVQVSRGTESGIQVLTADGKWCLWSHIKEQQKWGNEKLTEGTL
jgi:uncharacterized coiled-coil protein SlyX